MRSDVLRHDDDNISGQGEGVSDSQVVLQT